MKLVVNFDDNVINLSRLNPSKHLSSISIDFNNLNNPGKEMISKIQKNVNYLSFGYNLNQMNRSKMNMFFIKTKNNL